MIQAHARFAPVLAAALCLSACGRPAPNSALPPPANAAAPAPAVNAVAAAPAPIADVADAAEAKTFLDGLYAHYVSDKDNTFQMFDANKREVFDPDMLKLLAEDAKVLKGEVGVIDGDWLCACQDFVSLKTTVTVLSASPTEAKAVADFVDTGMSDQSTRHAAFDLVKTPAGWRIHDVTDAGETSLRTQLLDEIKGAEAGGGTD